MYAQSNLFDSAAVLNKARNLFFQKQYRLAEYFFLQIVTDRSYYSVSKRERCEIEYMLGACSRFLGETEKEFIWFFRVLNYAHRNEYYDIEEDIFELLAFTESDRTVYRRGDIEEQLSFLATQFYNERPARMLWDVYRIIQKTGYAEINTNLFLRTGSHLIFYRSYELLQYAESFATKTDDKETLNEIRSEFARIYTFLNQPVKAFPYWIHLTDKNNSANCREYIHALFNSSWYLSFIHSGDTNLGKATAFCDRALESAEEIKDKELIAACYYLSAGINIKANDLISGVPRILAVPGIRSVMRLTVSFRIDPNRCCGSNTG